MRKYNLLILLLLLALAPFAVASAEAPQGEPPQSGAAPAMMDDPVIQLPDATEDIVPEPTPAATEAPEADPNDPTDAQPEMGTMPDGDAEAIEYQLVGYYLTERDLGPDEVTIAEQVRAIVNEYGLAEGVHHLRSTLDTSYPDESATLVIEGKEATLTGPYFSRAYVVSLG